MKISIDNSRVRATVVLIKSIDYTTLNNGDIFYCQSDDNLYLYQQYENKGIAQPDNSSILTGWWVIDNKLKSQFMDIVNDGYDFNGNNKIDITNAVNAKAIKEKFYQFDNSAPRFISDNEIIGSAFTFGGVATFHMTYDGQANGIPIFDEICHIHPEPWNNSSNIAVIPLASSKRRHNEGVTDSNGKSVDVNVVDSNSIITAGEGLEFVPDGIEVKFYIKGII